MTIDEESGRTLKKVNEIKSDKISLSDIKLSKRENMALIIFVVAYLIYTGIVACMLFILQLAESTQWLIVLTYAIIAPLVLYIVWFLFCYQKLNKWPFKISFLGGNLTYLMIFLLLGVCVITWAKYWNSGIDPFWLGAALLLYASTENDLAFLLFYYIGSVAVTPALVEEFLKSFPSIIAFFVVFQRKRDARQKNKGLLGNELYGIIMGITIGIVFQVLELILYLIAVISNGTVLDVFSQVTLRGLAPIHILGGAIGGYAAGRAERIRFEKGEENLPFKKQVFSFIKRFLPFWAIPVLFHFSWNFLQILFSIFYSLTNNSDISFQTMVDVIILVSFSVALFLVLNHFLQKSNKIAIQCNRCPNTNIIVLEKGTICEPISESNLISQNLGQNTRYCTNCGTALNITFRFCTNCGFDMAIVDYSKSKREFKQRRFVHRFLVLAIIIGILFAIISVILNFFILVIDTQSFPVLMFDLLTDLAGAFTIIVTSYFLMRNQRRYSGKVNVWCWFLLIFNYIGLMFTCIIFGLGLIETGYVYSILGQDITIILPIIGLVLTIFGFLMLILLVLFFHRRGARYLLHYQNI